MDKPNNRSSHSNETPSLGGIAFFGSIMISMFLIRLYDATEMSFYIITSLTILFLMGMKDDLVVLSAKAKVILQSLAILLIITHPDMRIINLHGSFSIYNLKYWLGFALSFFSMLYILNAFNLIDGIDGLAALLGVFMSMVFGVFYFSISKFYYALLAITMLAFLLPFLKFNFSKEEKIFMGDTGSMIVGFLLSILALKFVNLSDNQLISLGVLPENVVIVTISILFFPVIDVIRVILIRLMHNDKPFSPDRRHLHHILIDKGLSHRKASITLTITSIFAFFIIYSINMFLNTWFLLLVFIILTVFTFYILLLLDQDPKAKKQRKIIKSYIPNSIYIQEFRLRKRIIIILKSFFYKDLI